MIKNIGLDLGQSTIKAVDIVYDKNTGKPIINNAYVLPMPAEAIVDGTILDYAELGEQLVKVIDSGGFGQKTTALAIKGFNTEAKKVNIPFANSEQFNNDIKFLADQYIRYNPEEYAMDYQILKQDKSKGMAQVVFVAMRKEGLADYISVLESSQLTATVIDVEACALSNLYNRLKLPDDKVSLIAHIGHASTQFIFLENGIFSYHEYSPTAGSYCTSLLVNMANIPADTAELTKVTPEAFTTGDAAKNIMESNFAPDFIRAAKFAISNYNLRGGDAPTRIYLSGGGATIYGLKTALEKEFEILVAVMDPTQGMDIYSSIAKQILEAKPAILNVAIAMALR